MWGAFDTRLLLTSFFLQVGSSEAQLPLVRSVRSRGRRILEHESLEPIDTLQTYKLNLNSLTKQTCIITTVYKVNKKSIWTLFEKCHIIEVKQVANVILLLIILSLSL